LLHCIDALLWVPRTTARLDFNNRHRATRRHGNDVRFVVADAAAAAAQEAAKKAAEVAKDIAKDVLAEAGIDVVESKD
jgi:glutathione synthase/RimK-type ligase-like ATP-grasp enzyme